jgi:quercetin dioxygenase-like cupin family protein
MTKKKGKAKSQPKARVKHVRWRDLHYEKLNPLLHRQFVVGQDVMLAHIRLLTGCVVPKHSHYHEQISYVMEGRLKFWVGRRQIIVHAGEVLAIPPHVPHKVEALRDSLSLDIFTPPREDWINKTDQYLREEPKDSTKPARKAA